MIPEEVASEDNASTHETIQIEEFTLNYLHDMARPTSPALNPLPRDTEMIANPALDRMITAKASAWLFRTSF